jgi:hypothetical protein
VQSNPEQTSPQLEEGMNVRTPSGAVAELLKIYADVDEGLVQWSNGDRARFKLNLLQAVPPRADL